MKTIAATGLWIVLAMADLSAQDISYRHIEKPDYSVFEDGITPRARVRANFYVGKNGDPWATSPGQISIEYGQPPWKQEYNALLEKLPAGRRWRLGSNFWSNLYSSFPFEVDGRSVEAGFYFMVLERTSADQWSLVLLQPEEMTRRQMDPWHVNLKDSGEGVITIPLQWEKNSDQKDELQIELKLDDDNPKKMKVHLSFGPHHFTSPFLQIRFK